MPASRCCAQGGHDGVIAFGGGSGLDTGKVIAFMAGQTRPMWDFEDIGDWWTRADPKGIFPIIAVPTTAGTGSEVGRAGVITDETTHTKKVIFHPLMMPKIVIADPELTVGMPAFITVGTGFDALAHCLEAYCAPGYHPLADGIAVEGIRLVLENLPKVVGQSQRHRSARPYDERGGDGRHSVPEGPRRHPCAEPSGRGALRHPSRHDQCGVHALCAGRQSRCDRGPDRPARRLLRPVADLRGVPPRRRIACATQLNVPHTLRDFKVDDAKRDLIGDMAIVDPTAGGNPVELTKARALEIFDRAYEGRL